MWSWSLAYSVMFFGKMHFKWWWEILQIIYIVNIFFFSKYWYNRLSDVLYPEFCLVLCIFNSNIPALCLYFWASANIHTFCQSLLLAEFPFSMVWPVHIVWTTLVLPPWGRVTLFFLSGNSLRSPQPAVFHSSPNSWLICWLIY